MPVTNADDMLELFRRLKMVEQRTGQIYDQVACTYVPLQVALTEAGGSLAGAALAVGTYTVGPLGSGTTYTFAYPATARAVSVRFTCRWASVNVNAAGYIIPNGGAAVGYVICRGNVTSGYSDSSGAVTLDSSGRMQLVIATANTNACELYVLGYFL